MAFDYDELYGSTPDALGAPTPIFVDFFAKHGSTPQRVLDVGCGQGRDAVFIARLGHHVTGVDLSANGIRDLKAAAAKEDLPITGIVADLTAFTPDNTFDIVLIDRTLHMLDRDPRLAALGRLAGVVAQGGWLLIADEKKNMSAMKAQLDADPNDWSVNFEKGGYLFVQRA